MKFMQKKVEAEIEEAEKPKNLSHGEILMMGKKTKRSLEDQVILIAIQSDVL
jgi:hypothetical protein